MGWRKVLMGVFTAVSLFIVFINFCTIELWSKTFTLGKTLEQVPFKTQDNRSSRHFFWLNESALSNGCTSSKSDYLQSKFQNASFLYLETELHRRRPDHFIHLKEFDEDRVFGGVACFQNAYIRGVQPPTIFDCESIFVPTSCYSQNANDKNKLKSPILAQGNNVVEIDAAVMIYQFWGDEYYHAMVEDLPRLAYVLEFLRIHPEIKILAGEKHLCRNSATWNKLLALNNTWVAYNPSRTYFAKRLLVPTGTLCGEAQTKCIEELQKTFDSTLGKYENDHKKILIVLQKREKRKIVNHEELLEALQTRFSSCCVVEVSDGTESLAENVARHRKAHIIIGPHGAGLSSAIFAHRGSSGMVELHPQKGNWFGKVNLCHQFTAKAAGLVTVLIQQADGLIFGQDFHVNVSSALSAVEDVMKTIELMKNVSNGDSL